MLNNASPNDTSPNEEDEHSQTPPPALLSSEPACDEELAARESLRERKDKLTLPLHLGQPAWVMQTI